MKRKTLQRSFHEADLSTSVQYCSPAANPLDIAKDSEHRTSERKRKRCLGADTGTSQVPVQHTIYTTKSASQTHVYTGLVGYRAAHNRKSLYSLHSCQHSGSTGYVRADHMCGQDPTLDQPQDPNFNQHPRTEAALLHVCHQRPAQDVSEQTRGAGVGSR